MAKKLKVKKPLEGLDLLTSGVYYKRYEILAKRVSNMQRMKFNMSHQGSSFTFYDEVTKRYYMNIDPWSVDSNSYGLESKNMLIRALIYHESAHLLFTNFLDWNKAGKEVEVRNRKIAEIAEDLMSATPTLTNDDLVEAIYNFYYQKFLMDMSNSMEDASIEASVQMKHPESYPNLVFLRNETTEKECQGIQTFCSFNISDYRSLPIEDYKKFISSIITEIRHLAVIGYRKPNVQHIILDELFTPDEIQEMDDIAIWCRFCAQTTAERIVGSQTLMDMLRDKILWPFAEKVTNEYKNALDELKNQIEQDANEFNKQNQNQQSMSHGPSHGTNGGSMSGGFGKGQGDLPIPKSLAQDVAQKIQQAMNQAQQSREQGQKRQGEEASQQSKNNPSQSSGENNEQENNEQDSSDTKNQGQKNVQDYNKPQSKEQLGKEAEKALQEALKNSAKTFEKAQENIDRSQIEGGEVLTENAAMHNGVKTIEGTIESFNENESRYGTSVKKKIPQLLQYANPLSKKMKKLLMYRARNRSLKGQYVGKLDMKSLYRANTDGRVFRKDTEGEKSNVRFCILVDESGSMSGSKIEKAIEGCYVVAKAAQRIKVPFSIYGHTEDRAFEMRQYVDYKNCFKKHILNNIFKMDARSCNRDGLAIYRALCSLVQSKDSQDEKQILIVISDGQPAGGWGSYYGGEEAIKEMQGIMNKFEYLYGIPTIGLAIGHGCPHVAEIYKHAVMVEDVSELPDKMMDILKSIVL